MHVVNRRVSAKDTEVFCVAHRSELALPHQCAGVPLVPNQIENGDVDQRCAEEIGPLLRRRRGQRRAETASAGDDLSGGAVSIVNEPLRRGDVVIVGVLAIARASGAMPRLSVFAAVVFSAWKAPADCVT